MRTSGLALRRTACFVSTRAAWHHSEAHQQSHETVTTVFEGSDGNLWVGMTREARTLARRCVHDGATAPGMPPATRVPSTSIPRDALARPASGGLYWLRDGQIGREAGMSDEVVYSMTGSPGEL